MKRYRNRLFLAIASLLICVGVCLGGCGNAEEGEVETPDDSVIVTEQYGGQENDIVTNINEDALAEKLGVDGVTIIDVYGEASETFTRRLAVVTYILRLKRRLRICYTLLRRITVFSTEINELLRQCFCIFWIKTVSCSRMARKR